MEGENGAKFGVMVGVLVPRAPSRDQRESQINHPPLHSALAISFSVVLMCQKRVNKHKRV